MTTKADVYAAWSRVKLAEERFGVGSLQADTAYDRYWVVYDKYKMECQAICRRIEAENAALAAASRAAK